MAFGLHVIKRYAILGACAVLLDTSLGQTTCVTPPPGLVGWWRAETNVWDQVGGNIGVFLNGASFVSGEVGLAFNFDGSGNYVTIPAAPSLDVGNGPGFSVEAWINPNDLNSGRPVFEWALPNVYGVHLWINAPNPGCLYGNLADTAGGLHIIQSAPGVITGNVFQHVALTYDRASGIAELFVNGSVVQSNFLGSILARTSSSVFIGYRPASSPFGPVPFIGFIDEVSLYNRALSAEEVQAIYTAGSFGKCQVPIQPFIVIQPTNQTTTVTSNAMFYVAAGGTPQLSFQWSLNGSNIAGATGSTLVLTNIQPSQAGNYSVLITNAYGFVASSNALLTLRYPPVSMLLVGNTVPAGNMIAIPVLAVANGNENALGFSLNFDPTKLTYIGATVGSGAPGAVLTSNATLIASGKLGLSLALPPNQNLSAGTQQVVQVNFAASPVSANTTTPVSFGDQPTPRQLWDAQLGTLAANYSNASVFIYLPYPPATILLASNNVSAGGTLTMPVLVAANGNEHAMNFSLSFDATKLIYVGATVGSGAPGASLARNAGSLSLGRLGLSLTLPSGQSLSPGTQQVVQVSFVAAVLTSAALTPINFGDQPTQRQLWDTQLAPLPANYSSTQVSISVVSAFEGDAFPRPNGDRTVTLSDWLQTGRYVAGLDFPTNASEFQRVDCAPRAFSGDGAISVADWVQVGRFEAGLDPVTPAAGPVSQTPWFGVGPSSNRLVTVGAALLAPAQPCSLDVALSAQGDENAVGFSLSYDPSLVTFVGAVLGSDAQNSTAYLNTNQAGLGRLGFAIALGTGSSFAPGNRQLLTLTFLASPSASGSFAPGLRDGPVLRDVADISGNSLAVGFTSAGVPQNVAPTLSIARSGTNVALLWPLWATNLALQQAGAVSQSPGHWTNVIQAALATNNVNLLSTPMTNQMMFFRLFPR